MGNGDYNMGNQQNVIPYGDMNKDIITEVARIIASDSSNEKLAIEKSLEFLGSHYRLQRTYVFENNPDDDTISNTFEWCAEGVTPEIDSKQRLTYEKDLGFDYFNVFDENGMYLCADINNMKYCKKELLIETGTTSFLQYALSDDGKYVGFIGFDSNTANYSWTPEIVHTLWLCANFISLFIMQRRKRSEGADATEYLKALDDTDLYFYIINPKNFEITFINKLIRDSINTDVCGQKCYKAFIGIDAPCPSCPVIMREQWEINFPQEILRPDGMYLLSNATPIHWRGKERMLITCQDVTQYRRAIADAEIEKDSLERANKAKSSFLARMSHDIRTPINGIVGMSKMARDKSDDKLWVESCLDKIDASAKHLSMLVNDVLDLSKIESGSFNLTPAPVDLKAILDNCLVILNGMLLGRNLKISVDSECEISTVVMGDELYLRQIIVNILSNALKFTKDGGKITITEKISPNPDSEGMVMFFSVEDTGIGMSEAFLKRIYEPFSQEDEQIKTKYKGSGLGMVIVKNLVELMGGHIDIKSEEGFGTTVSLTIPFAPVPPEEREKAEAVLAASEKDRKQEGYDENTLKGMRILVAEDNDLNMEIVQYLLKESGAGVIGASDGREAVRVFNDSREGFFDAILMDIMMPVMNGYEATKAIRKLNRSDNNVPIIAASANSFADDVDQALQSGMNTHVSKPIEADKLIAELLKFKRN